MSLPSQETEVALEAPPGTPGFPEAFAAAGLKAESEPVERWSLFLNDLALAEKVLDTLRSVEGVQAVTMDREQGQGGPTWLARALRGTGWTAEPAGG